MTNAVRHGLPTAAYSGGRKAGTATSTIAYVGGGQDTIRFSAQPHPQKKKLNPFLRLAAVAAFALVSMFGGVRGLPAAHAASLPINQGPAITQVVEAPNYGYTVTQADDVHINVQVVDSADDIPIPAAGSQQYVIEAAVNPLVSAESREYINQRLQEIHDAGVVGNVYIVIAPDISGDVQQLAHQINQRLNPGNDGAVILVNAKALQENHQDIRDTYIYYITVCTSNGKTTTCHLQPMVGVRYTLHDNMLQVSQGGNMFSDLAAELERAGGNYDDEAVQAQYQKIMERMAENPQQTSQELADYFASQLSGSRSDQAYTLYQGDFDQAMRNMADTAAHMYKDPLYRYLKHRADRDHLNRILLTVGLGLGGATAVGGAAYAIKRKLDGY